MRHAIGQQERNKTPFGISVSIRGMTRLRSSGGDRGACLVPIPLREFVQPLHWMIGDPGDHIGEPGGGIDVVQLRGRDQRT
jgi:hypothetical protein